MKDLAEQVAILRRDGRLGGTPTALVIAEDDVALQETITHVLGRGFGQVLVALPAGIEMDCTDAAMLRAPTEGPGCTEALVNAVLSALPSGTWLHYCYNAEFLIHPFGETRRITEMLEFHASERRSAMATLVVDLFARDLGTHPNGVDLDRPAFDRTGYFQNDGTIQGGLRWRHAPDIPPNQQRLDRYSLVQAKPGLHLGPDHTWSDPELNTLSCPWHRNLTASIASFRAAKALTKAPGPGSRITSFDWPGAKTFDWTSGQLLDAGFMEVGQWF